MKLKPKSFISETIEVIFDQTPTFEKKPPCPDGFIWRDEGYRIVELLSEWSDFQRRGRYSRNMRPENIKKTLRRGSIGVGRFYFQVKTDRGGIFELYYDRVVKNSDERKGEWMLFRELEEAR